MFKEEREESQFEWSMLGDIEKGRPNLGPMVHVSIYRLMQYTLRDILIRDFGVEQGDKAFFEAGKKAGEAFCKNVLDEEKDLNGLFADLILLSPLDRLLICLLVYLDPIRSYC